MKIIFIYLFIKYIQIIFLNSGKSEMAPLFTGKEIYRSTSQTGTASDTKLISLF